MTGTTKPITRRGAMVGMTSGVAVGVLPPQARAAEEPTAQFHHAYETVMAGRAISPGAIEIDMPDFAEDGAMVPFTIGVPSPMTAQDHITTVSILSTGNPQPIIATFSLTQLSGRAAVSGRLRLARSQDVIVIAQTSAGLVLLATANVKVTVGGCGSG